MVGVDARALSSRRRSAIEMSSPTYDRAPSPRLRQLLAPGEFLAPLLANAMQKCANLMFRPGRAKEFDQGVYSRDVWGDGEPGFARALDVFLGGVQVDPRQLSEGAIQARWAQVEEPWIAFDKEAALAYKTAGGENRYVSSGAGSHQVRK